MERTCARACTPCAVPTRVRRWGVHMDAKSYSLLHTQLCDVTSIGHIAPWLRAQTEDTQHGHAQQAGA